MVQATAFAGWTVGHLGDSDLEIGGVVGAAAAAVAGVQHGHYVAQVARVGGGGNRAAFGPALGSDQLQRVALEDGAQRRIDDQRHVARQRVDLDRRPDGVRTCLKRPIHLRRRVGNRLVRRPAHECFEPHIGRYDINSGPAVRQDRVNAHVVLVAERLALQVNRL